MAKPFVSSNVPAPEKIDGWLPVMGSSTLSDAVIILGILLLSTSVGLGGVKLMSMLNPAQEDMMYGKRSLHVAVVDTEQACSAFNVGQGLQNKPLTPEAWKQLGKGMACIQSESWRRSYEIRKVSN